MSNTLRLRVCGPVSIHGRKPNEEFDAETDADGVVLDMLTRKRVADGSFERVTATAPEPQPPAPQATTAKTKKEG